MSNFMTYEAYDSSYVYQVVGSYMMILKRYMEQLVFI